MADILRKITEQTNEDLQKRKREISFRDLESFGLFGKERLKFSEAINKDGTVSIIAEIKQASPSKGIIRQDFNPLKLVDTYIENGASAISVLTDEPFFQGSLNHLEKAAEISTVPLLRKDFILEPYQVKEARAYGADAVLLIDTLYDGGQLYELLAATKEFELQALVECYHQEEIENLNWDDIEIVGVNNRNLSTFEVDLHRGVELLGKVPAGIVRVSESGISKPEDLRVLYQHGIHSALIGEHFMKQKDTGNSLKNFINEFEELNNEINHE